MNRTDTRYLNTRYARRGSLAGIAAAALLAVTAAHAADPGKLALAAYSNGAAGADVMAGNYVAAISKLAPHGLEFYADAVAASTNLCVAYVATHQFTQARAACDEAVHEAKLDVFATPPMERVSGSNAEVALARSNLEVLSKLETREVAKLDRR
ncbi:MAG TPA: hypothetical protein VMB48_06545 [Steroidobacteraceae bacterium]|nr:hypothetical protein [Steroidobacteraceae bacterium]